MNKSAEIHDDEYRKDLIVLNQRRKEYKAAKKPAETTTNSI